MKWQCPYHQNLVYYSGGKCRLCSSTLMAVVPKVTQIIATLTSSPETIRSTLDLANTIAKRLF